MWRRLARFFSSFRVIIKRQKINDVSMATKATKLKPVRQAAFVNDNADAKYKNPFMGTVEVLPKDVFGEICSYLSVNDLVGLSMTGPSFNSAVEQLGHKCDTCDEQLFHPKRKYPPSGCSQCRQRCGECNSECDVCKRILCCNFLSCAICEYYFCPACKPPTMFPCSVCLQAFCGECEDSTATCEDCDNVFCTECRPVLHCSGCRRTLCALCNEDSTNPVFPCTIGMCGTEYCSICQPKYLWVCGAPFCNSSVCRYCPRFSHFKDTEYCCDRCEIQARLV